MATPRKEQQEITIQQAQKSLVPIPDPTTLTTQQLYRELGTLREMLETRLDGMDKAVTIAVSASIESDRLNEKLNTIINNNLNSLKEVYGEKFNGIQTQFKERDTRTDQTSKDNKLAIDAALQAAKEAVSEQNRQNTIAIARVEAAFTKQSDQVAILITTTTKILDDKIDDIKARITAVEGRSKGIGEGWGLIVGFMGVIFGIISAVTIVVHVVMTAGK